MKPAIAISQLFALTLALGAAGSAAAQVRGGAFGVVNVSKMTSDAAIAPLDRKELDFIASKTRFGGGVVLEYGINDNVAVVLEPMFVGKGAGISGSASVTVAGPGVNAKVDGSVLSRYLEVPLQLKLGPSTDGLRPYLLAGPSVGFRLGNVVTNGSIRVSQGDQLLFEEPLDGSNDISKLDLSIAVGGGLMLPVEKGQLFVEAQYVAGLKDVDTSPNTARNRGIHVRLGFTFPLGGGR